MYVINFVTYNKINRKKKLPVQNEKITDPDTGEQKYTGSAPAGHHNNGCLLSLLCVGLP